MMASSLWLITATTLAYQGHPLTAGLIALPLAMASAMGE
jgi:hypothetical protein